MKLKYFKVGDKVASYRDNYIVYEIKYLGTRIAVLVNDRLGVEEWSLVDNRDDWQHVPEKKKVTKWLWADPADGHITHFLSECPKAEHTLKLEWSATEFDED